MSTFSRVFPIQSDQISGFTPGGYPIGDRAISSQDLADIDNEIYSNGIISTAPVSGAYYQVTAHSGMNIRVLAGKCFIRGRRANTPVDTVITVAAPNSLADRADRVVLRLDLTNEVRDVVLDIKTGTTSLTRTSSIWELGLADILVRRGVTSITAADITDLRFNSEICGRSFAELLSVDTTGIFNQVEALIRNQSTTWQNQTNQQRQDFIAWQAQINQWRDLTVAELAKAIDFNMDNIASFPGTTYNCTFNSATSITERLTYNSGGLLAERQTTFNANGSITELITVNRPDGTVFRRTQVVTTFNANGSISASVTAV